MLTIQNRVKNFFTFFLLLAMAMTACTPAGPRALLKGKRSLDRGNYEEAIRQLQTATSLLTTNADAWNSLGLAYHHSGAVSNAIAAYQRSIHLDPNLGEARYNLGCLWLEQGQAERARDEFMAFNLHHGNSADGWMRLGMAQARSREARDVAAAENSLHKSLAMRAANPEAWNELGMLHLRRNRAQNAAQCFAEALKHQPDYAPALLNLAIVFDQHLNEKAAALQRYSAYLALKPRPANWDAVNAIVRDLQQPATIAAPQARPAPAQTNVAVQQSVPQVQTSPPPAAASVTPSRTSSVSPAQLAVTRTETSAPPVRPPAVPQTVAAPPAALPATSPPPAAPVDVVRLPAEPTIRPAQDIAPARQVETRPVEVRPAPPASNTSTSVVTTARTEDPERRGVLQRVNPLNVFRRDTPPQSRPTPLPPDVETARSPEPAGVVPEAALANRAPETGTNRVVTHERYRYRSPAAPVAGNQAAADRAFAQALQAHRANRIPEAVVGYRQAIEQDPTHFDAHYNLGLASVASGNLPQALIAYETALAIRPQSLDARYNFALVLKQARYPIDSAAELQKILQQFPRDARTHAALGNLYAHELRQPDRARDHYMKALESDPRHPQADRIRYWLAENPR